MTSLVFFPNTDKVASTGGRGSLYASTASFQQAYSTSWAEHGMLELFMYLFMEGTARFVMCVIFKIA